MGRIFWLLLLVAVAEGARRRLKDPAIYRSQHGEGGQTCLRKTIFRETEGLGEVSDCDGELY